MDDPAGASVSRKNDESVKDRFRLYDHLQVDLEKVMRTGSISMLRILESCLTACLHTGSATFRLKQQNNSRRFMGTAAV
jgi:hypothetical protein